jgi:hypothetical protein
VRLRENVLPLRVQAEIRRVITPQAGWHVLEAEWAEDKNMLYLVDALKFNDEVLLDQPFLERYQLLPRVCGSSCVTTLPLLRSLKQCLSVLDHSHGGFKGVIFKSARASGRGKTVLVRGSAAE